MVANKKLTTSDALAFVRLVKTQYQYNREIYDRFLKVMKDYRAQRVDTRVLISRVKELFKGQPEILLAFNVFLPMGYEITLIKDDKHPPKKSTAHFDDAFHFVNRVKSRFENDKTFDSFLEVLNTYKKKNKSVAELYNEVAILFRGHQDLLEEFHHFLPRCG
ncbi:PREDICTED: paired amphipathic helix protein Sin3-like 1 [Camelina sativa]|uniref:Paired amphipathic helix protein Sin3-like 1 n=1 Tax=Camelina sativa TaxID=90675 RepID=A0ABM0WH34_CAMSA|nr:PREDICTED: paired amphipathic helix protein Sin3-like 1 [Camelina sativa]